MPAPESKPGPCERATALHTGGASRTTRRAVLFLGSAPGRRRAGRATVASAAMSVVLAACGSSSTAPTSTSSAPTKQASYAATHFTTKLSGVCPATLTIQTNWLPEPDHGALYELIGTAGTMAPYSYEGPLGSTGIRLRILTGGPGNAYQPIPTTLYAGNPVAKVTPQLGMGSADTVMQLSKKFPVTGVMSLQEHDPLALIYDPSVFHNLNSIAALKTAVAHGAHFYVQSLQTGYVQYLISKGIPVSAMIGGFKGNLGQFSTGNGKVILGGFADGAALKLEHYTPSWNKPVGVTLLYKLGFNDYDEVIEVANSQMHRMQGCLQKLVPLLQHAQVDYVQHPTTVNGVLAKFNSHGYGAAFWSTLAAYNKLSVATMLRDKIVANSNHGAGPIGAFNMARVTGNIAVLTRFYRHQGSTTYSPSLTASKVVTNRFIDPAIKLPSS